MCFCPTLKDIWNSQKTESPNENKSGVRINSAALEVEMEMRHTVVSLMRHFYGNSWISKSLDLIPQPGMCLPLLHCSNGIEPSFLNMLNIRHSREEGRHKAWDNVVYCTQEEAMASKFRENALEHWPQLGFPRENQSLGSLLPIIKPEMSL